QGRPPAVLGILHSWFGLLFVDGFLEFGTGAKLRDFAGSDLNGRAGLWIASVPRFSLRHREGSKADQRYPIPFAEGRRDAFDGGINGSRGLRFADFASAFNFVNQISL